MAVIIQIRRDTQANWGATNPVLAIGEMGLDLDNSRAKIGDGSTTWCGLDYFLHDSATINNISSILDIDITASPCSNQVLAYNSASLVWQPYDVSGLIASFPSSVAISSIDHSSLIGVVGFVYSHSDIDTHISDTSIHFTMSSINHSSINNAESATYSHSDIDAHICSTATHFTISSINHSSLNGAASAVYDHSTIDTHICNTGIHFDFSSITAAFPAAVSATVLAISSIGDVDVTASPCSNQVLAYFSSSQLWQPTDVSALVASFPSSIAESSINHSALLGVTGTFYSHSDIDTHISNTSIHFPISSTIQLNEEQQCATLDLLTNGISAIINVCAGTPSQNDVLLWDVSACAWVSRAPTGGSATVTDLSSVCQVNITTLSNADVLTWVTTASEWQNKESPAGAGGGLSGITTVSSTLCMTLANSDCLGNKYFHNDGATASYEFRLTDASANLMATFINAETDKPLIVTSVSSDLIYLGDVGVTSIVSVEKYVSISVIGINDSEWATTRYGNNGSYGGWGPYGVRGVFGGGQSGTTYYNTIDYVTITVHGNASDFGDLTKSRYSPGGVASTTRGCFGGGGNGTAVSTIDYITIASVGNATTFGTLTRTRLGCGGCGSPTRGVFGGGYDGTSVNEIDYIEIATTGNATDFGDLASSRPYVSSMSSSTRGIFAGGTNTAVIDYITIASTGNSTSFGNLSGKSEAAAGCGSSTRGLICGGLISVPINIIEYITIASTGNTTDFGDLTVARYGAAACSDTITGIIAAGIAAAVSNVIDYVTIATTGNATDFGDATISRSKVAGLSSLSGGTI